MTPPLDPNDLAKQILAEPAFRNVHTGLVSPSFWDRVVAWINDHLASLFAGARGELAAASLATIGNVLLVFALFAIVFVAFRLTIQITAGSPTYRSPRSSPARDRSAVPDLRLAATQAAEKSQYGLAIVLLFQASLQLLDEARVVRYDASRTAGEYERLLRKSKPSCLEPFRTVARRFALIAFAAMRAESDDYAACRSAIVALEAAVA